LAHFTCAEGVDRFIEGLYAVGFAAWRRHPQTYRSVKNSSNVRW
jgi:hypothetical protein